MKSRNDRIIDWAIKKVQLEYRKDICLLVVYGSYVNSTEDSLSDVDFYFIPKNDKANELCRTFIIEGIGYDLFPIRWERIEGLATLNESLTPLLGKAKIVYSGSDEDRKRFEKLQGILNKNLADPSFMHQKAVDKLTQANDAWSRLVVQSDLCNCRLLAGDVLLQLADAVAYENLTYFKKGLKTQLADLKTMNKLPGDFLQVYEAVIKANTIVQIQERCGKLIASCKNFLNHDIKTAVYSRKTDKPVQEPPDIDFHALAELYGEIISTFNKIYKYCESNNGVLAFISAVSLQRTLNDDAQGIRFDILSDYDIADLSRLSASVKSAEAQLVNYITGGITIKRYASVDEFLKEN
jgi:predicted nucleotidyltransferase